MQIFITFLIAVIIILAIAYAKEMSDHSITKLSKMNYKAAHKECMKYIAKLTKQSYSNGINNFDNSTDQNGINN